MSRTWWTFVLAFCLLIVPAVAPDASAQTRTETLRWTDDVNTDVAGYRVHYGLASRDYTQSEDAGIPAIVSGAFEYDIEVDATADVYVAVTAYNTEAESFFSNERCRGAAGECATGSGSDGGSDASDVPPSETPSETKAGIAGFVLWNAETDGLIDANFESGEQISLADHGCTAIEIVGNAYLATFGTPGSIMKVFDGQVPNGCSDPGRSHENNSPFAWEVETGAGKFECAPTLTEPGIHTLTVTPFDGEDCTGPQGTSVTLEFEVVAPGTENPPPPGVLGRPGQPTLVLD
jgi:hypothetical protein